jgi:hypothetical protein
VVTAQEIRDAIFGYSEAKYYLGAYFAVIAVVVLVVMLLIKNEQEETNVKRYIAIFAFIGLIGFIYWFFFRVGPTATYFEPEPIWLGNESENITQKDYDRLYYIQDHFVIVKRSFLDTPSLYDYADDGRADYLDRSADYWKSNNIEPQFDVHVYDYNGYRIYRVLLFFPTQRNTKHALDFEYYELYYEIANENNTETLAPDYISFPTYRELTQHPRVLLTWNEMPVLEGDTKALALDVDTNAFASNYWKFPKYNSNQPGFNAPAPDEMLDYMTQTEQWMFGIGVSGFILLFLYNRVYPRKRRFTVFYSMLIFILIALFPVLSLQYDYVSNPTFRVWTESTPQNDPFYNSQTGNEYYTIYGVPWERSSWDRPDWTDLE